jgi:hypothetical protein
MGGAPGLAEQPGLRFSPRVPRRPGVIPFSAWARKWTPGRGRILTRGMAEKNPFELEGRDGGPDAKKPARVWTAAEQAEKLHGYIEVDPAYWDMIRYGTHVRYYTKAGEFRTGGFVAKNPYDVKPRGEPAEKRFMRLQNNFNDKARGYASWLLAYEDAGRIFMKPDAGVLMMMKNLESAVKGLNENIRKLAEHAKKLDGRIAALEGRR